MNMKDKSVLFLLILFVFTLGSSPFLLGAELVDFKKKLEKYDDTIRTTNQFMKKVKEAQESVIKAGTPEEKSEAYAMLADRLAESVINYKKVENTLDDVLADLRSGINLGNGGAKTIKGELTNLIGDIHAVFDEMEGTLLSMDSNTGTGRDLGETMKETKDLFRNMLQNAKERYNELIKLIDVGGKENDKNVIHSLQTSFEYAKSVIRFSRQMYTVNFKFAAAVGKVTNMQDKLRNLLTEHGMPDRIIEGVWLDQYDTDYIHYVMRKDISNINIEHGLLSPDYWKELRGKIAELKSMPRPGKVEDDDPIHKYFYDRGKKRWFWVSEDNPREKHYAPFDYEAGTGAYIKYKNGKWYSFAPIYNGHEVEIFPDEVLEGQKKGG